MAERLKAADRMGVVVGVSLQMEQDAVGDHGVAVPAVGRPHAFVPSVGRLLSAQAVVLEVVTVSSMQNPMTAWPANHGTSRPHSPRASYTLRRSPR
jgi:hypothetical protein